MVTLDKYYSLKESESAFYDWVGLVIKLDCNENEIMLNEENDSSDNYMFSHFVHEYIHFLQNFAMPWGATVYIDLAIVPMKVGASLNEIQKDISSPLKKDSVNNSLWKDALTLRQEIIEKLNYGESFKVGKNIKTTVLSYTYKNHLVEFTNGVSSRTAGVKVIREHMAHMGEQLFLNKSDIEINEIINRRKNELSIYTMIFEYFFEKNKFVQIREGIFHLMQICLMTLQPVNTLTSFFQWLDNVKTLECNSLLSIVNTWFETIKSIKLLENDFIATIWHCKNVKTSAEKFEGIHDYYGFINPVVEYVLNNLNQVHSREFLFDPSNSFVELSNQKFWKNKVGLFGSGIINFLDGVKIYGETNHCNNLNESFTYLLSTNLSLKMAIEGEIKECPFLNSIPICKCDNRIEDNCYDNPFLATLLNESMGEELCLFRNGQFLLGLKDKIKFH